MSKNKIDLSLLKRLVSELDSLIASAEGMSTDIKADKNEWVLELSKATGVAASVMTEAGLLIGDIQQEIVGVPPAEGKQDVLAKILGGIKGTGNTN